MLKLKREAGSFGPMQVTNVLMRNKNNVRQKLCSLNLYEISYAVTGSLKIMKYSPSTMITHSRYFEIIVVLLFVPENCE